MNPDLNHLQPYPFQQLAKLKEHISPPQQLKHISLSIGEPKHTPPTCVTQCLQENLKYVANYSATGGSLALREAIAQWATQRFDLKQLSAQTNILPVNGTREGIFAFVQASIDHTKAHANVLMPNPFYQIYEGAAYLAGAKPIFLNCNEENNYVPDLENIPEETWRHCQLLILCSPGNPTGAVLPLDYYKKALTLADKYNFIIASDECYSELYFDEDTPPIGLLEACQKLGRDDYKRCVVFHSLSKRSNLPGLRSGFIAGDADILKSFLLYRTYHGCAMPLHVQQASIAAWSDETHVRENRRQYREKFTHVLALLEKHLDVKKPDAGFYLWPKVACDDQDFAQRLFAEQNITVLPGSYLARNTESGNPGSGRIRMALVASVDECIEAAMRIKDFVNGL